MAQNFAVYSLSDIQVVISHPKVGKCVVSEQGGGRIVIGYSGDLSSHTNTANGYVVVNRIRSKNGTVSMELPQNSPSDIFMRKLINYLSSDSTATSNFALGILTLKDPVANRTLTCTGLTPQKRPDDNYDQTSGMRNYGFLAAEVSET